MPWTYSQATGTLRNPQGEIVATNGYSGSGVGRNNTAMERERNAGPIPRGAYRIGASRNSTRTGPNSMDLTPAPGTNTFGRDAFLIHGDNSLHTASHGCVIFGPNVRGQISR